MVLGESIRRIQQATHLVAWKAEWKNGCELSEVVTELGFVELVTFLRFLWIHHHLREKIFGVTFSFCIFRQEIQDKWSQVVFLDTSWCLGLGRLVSTNSSNVKNLWVSGVPMVRSREMLQVWRWGFDHSKSWLGEFPQMVGFSVREVSPKKIARNNSAVWWCMFLVCPPSPGPLWPPGWHEKCFGPFQSKRSWLPLLLGRRTTQGKLVQLMRYKFVDPTSRPSISTGSNTSPGQISTQNISSGSIGRTWHVEKVSSGTPKNTPKWSFLVGKPMVVGYHMVPPFEETSKSPIWRPWYGTCLQNPPWYSTTAGETSTTVIRFNQHGNFLTKKNNIKPMTHPRILYLPTWKE